LYPNSVRTSNIGQSFQKSEHTLEISTIHPAYITTQKLFEILLFSIQKVRRWLALQTTNWSHHGRHTY